MVSDPRPGSKCKRGCDIGHQQIFFSEFVFAFNTIQYSTCIAPFSLGKPSDSEALATSGQSSVKAASNKKVFNLDLKVLKSLVHLMSAGREFQTAGAA